MDTIIKITKRNQMNPTEACMEKKIEWSSVHK